MARRGITTMMQAGESRAANAAVRRSRLIPRTRARAFGRPNLEENPAARMTTLSLGKVTAFIASIMAA
jgi:hypothetical protein